MFYLRTGGNGSGKTLLTLKDVRELQLQTGRPVYFNIRPADDPKKPDGPYSNLKPETIAEFGWKPFRFAEWESIEDNAIFLVDECHYDIPKMGTANPPAHIQRLTEHRARGFDFFLLTQHPGNINVFVRKLVQAPGWHQHIKRLAGALPVANVIQWDAVNLSCEQAGSGKSGEVKTRPYPREVYGWYDSAVLHTGRTRIPKAVWVLIACCVLIPWLVYRGFTNVAKKDGVPKGKEAVTATAKGGAGAAPRTASELVAAHRPRIAGLVHTAPIYDRLTEPKRVPVPAACMESRTAGCKCFTQDATVYQTTEDICRQIVRSGLFLAFSPNGDAQGVPLVPPVAAKPPEAVQARNEPVYIADGTEQRVAPAKR